MPDKELFADMTLIPVDWSKVQMLVPADQVTVLNMEDIQPCEIKRYVKFTFPETSETVSVEENNDEIPKE